ncbi:hypothetical protein D3C75_1369300 [compost metagenome]
MRVVRVNSCVPMRFSSAATARVTLAADMPKRRAAAEKPWSWATAAKTCISWKRSMGVSSIQVRKSQLKDCDL